MIQPVFFFLTEVPDLYGYAQEKIWNSHVYENRFTLRLNVRADERDYDKEVAKRTIPIGKKGVDITSDYKKNMKLYWLIVTEKYCKLTLWRKKIMTTDEVKYWKNGFLIQRIVETKILLAKTNEANCRISIIVITAMWLWTKMPI